MHAQLPSGLSTVGAGIPPAPPWLRAKGCGLLPPVPEFHRSSKGHRLSGEHCSIIEYPFCWCAPYNNHIWIHSQLNPPFIRGFWWLNQSGATGLAWTQFCCLTSLSGVLLLPWNLVLAVASWPFNFSLMVKPRYRI